MADERGLRATRRTDPAALFWANVDRTDGCWLWTAAVDRSGYGKFQQTISSTAPKQRHYRAHRYSFFLAHGRWPKTGLLHSCHVPGCVNPDHLREGTQSQNVIDSVLRGTHRTVRATPGQVTEWRRRHQQGEGIRAIARAVSMPYPTVRAAIARRSWRHVP